jgi:opacity protein-like surface antigen
MIGLRALRSKRSVVALAAACGLQCAWNAHAQPVSPPPGKALVVMYRADRQAVAARVPVVANADRLGDIGNGEYITASVNPGRTFLRAGDRVLSTLTLQTAPNQTYYVLIEAVGSNPVRVDMRQVPAGTARDALARSRPASAAPRAPLAAAPVAAAAAARPSAPAPAPAPAPAATPVRPAPAPAAPPPPQRQAAQPSAPAKPAPAAAPEPEEEEEADQRMWRFAAIAKTGSFNMGSTSQPIGGQQTSFKKGSKPVVGLEVEYRHRDGLAFGGEVFYYKNEVSLNGSPLKGDQEVVAAMLNAKYYFAAKSWLYPFIGVGGGLSNAKFSGDINGKMSGSVYQAMLGADFRFSSTFGLYLEYKFLKATTSDDAGQKLDVGGSGLLAGLSVAF